MAQIDWITPFLQVILVFRSIFPMGNWTKVLQHSMSRHNMTNHDKPKLVNYNRETGLKVGHAC